VEGETTYTVDEAAAILEETPERVREMLTTGELDGIPPDATLSGVWKVFLPATLGEDQAPPAEESTEGPPRDEDEAPPAQEDTDEFVGPSRNATDTEAGPPATEQLSRGDSAAIDREATAPSGWVSTQQAARALGISPRTVRWHIEQGNLQAKPEGKGVKRTWLVSIDSLQAFRDARQAAGYMPRDHRVPPGDADIAAESFGNPIRELADRLAEEAARAAEYRVQLQLTEQAASTVRAELEAELEAERRRREEAERERDELRRRLQTRPEPRGSPPTPTPAPQRAEPRPEPRPPPVGPQRGSVRRALWRRVFGG
jgi:hypothetical protein